MRGDGHKRCRTIAEEWFSCPTCGLPAGSECPGDRPHAERGKKAQMAWWGCTEDEIPARAARAAALKKELAND